jgi:hypothetical protein
MKNFRIPDMDIQDKLLNLDSNPKLIILIKKLEKIIEKYRHNWGIRGKGYKIEYDLERQWYPIFSTPNRWLANAITKLIAQ